MIDYLKVIFPFFVFLLLGFFLVKLFFNFFSKKRTNIWDKELKNILEESEIKTDKELHKELLIRNSYINSIQRLDEFLTKIYKEEKKVFNLSPLDAFMLIEIFPFDIRKSEDGKYYLIDKTNFLFFLRLIKNGNHNFISDEKLLELREKLLNKLLSWNKDNLLIDAKYIFDLILNNNIPDDDINNQTFIKLASSLKGEEKVLFKIEELKDLEESELKNKLDLNKNEKAEKEENRNISILKGNDFDYIIDLEKGVQYQIPKQKDTEEDKKEKSSDINRLANLIENLTILFASQPEAIKNAFKETIDEKFKDKNIEEIDNKTFAKEIKKSIENNNSINKEAKSQILEFLNKEIGVEEPSINLINKLEETKNNDENINTNSVKIIEPNLDKNNKDLNENLINENDKEVQNQSSNLSKNKSSNKDILESIENNSINNHISQDNEEKEDNLKKDTLNKVESLEIELDIMSDDTFLNDFALGIEKPELDLTQENKDKNNNSNEKDKKKVNTNSNEDINNNIENKINFIISEIKSNNLKSLNFNLEEIINNFINEIFVNNTSSMFFSIKEKKYAIDYCDFIKYLFTSIGEKEVDNSLCRDQAFSKEFLEQTSDYFVPNLFEFNSKKIIFLTDRFKLKINQFRKQYNIKIELIKKF